MKLLTILSTVVNLSLVSSAAAFSPHFVGHSKTGSSTKINSTPGPPSWDPANSSTPPPTPESPVGTDEDSEGETLKANRWSAHAPDPNLPTEEFRHQLKENMKRDLERRRAADPNRGNQPAKSYLDSL